MKPLRQINAKRGFTLVEIAVVLVIVATMLTMGLGLINAQLTSVNYNVTKKRQEVIKDTLIAYFAAFQRLPCPNVPVPGNTVDGTEPACVGATATGVLPFVALGMTRESAEDGWGNLFRYSVYADAAAACPGTGIDWKTKACYGAGKPGSLPQLVVREDTLANPVAPPLNNSQFVAVVISHGSNGLGAWVASLGTKNAPPLSCEEAHNAGSAVPPATVPPCVIAPNTFYKGERAPLVDDVVATLTANDIFIALAKQGAVKSKEAQINAELQLLYDQALALRVNNCTSQIPTPSSVLDPWGRPYLVSNWDGTLVNAWPVCVYSQGAAGTGTMASDATCTVTNTPIPLRLDKTIVNAALAKAGSAPCP
jgi:prepilin-type N-terminal cleavage/methylation domain-containing protein